MKREESVFNPHNVLLKNSKMPKTEQKSTDPETKKDSSNLNISYHMSVKFNTM